VLHAAAGCSAAPPKKGKATSPVVDHVKTKKKVHQQKQVAQKPNDSTVAPKRGHFYQSSVKTPLQVLNSNFVLQHNTKGKVFAKFVGTSRNVFSQHIYMGS